MDEFFKNNFVSYEIAKLANEHLFDEPCIAAFETESNWHMTERPWRNSEDDTEIASPLKQQVFDWFQKEHGIFVGPVPFTDYFFIRCVNWEHEDKWTFSEFNITILSAFKLIPAWKNK